MLSEQATQLLTAYVDGELSQRKRTVVMRLLQKSSEARALLLQLQENAHRIKHLPRRNVEPSLVEDVLQAIAAQQMPTPQPIRLPSKRGHWLPYLAAGLAASLLIGAIGILGWRVLHEPEHKALVKHTPVEKKHEHHVPPEVHPIPAPRKEPNKLLASMVEGTFGGFGAPIPVEKAFTASFRDLHKGVVSGQLTHELNRDKTVQLDVTVKNIPMAMERLKAALHERGVKVVVDPDASKSLKKAKQKKVEYLVYAGNLSSDEVTAVLKDLSLNDTKGKKNEPSPYEKVTLSTLSKNEKQHLTRVLGIDLTSPKKENANPPANQERAVVLLPVHANAKASEQVRQAAHQNARAGAVQLLIKIHQD